MRRRPWPNGIGVTYRVGRYHVEHCHAHARCSGFPLPAAVAGAFVTFTHDRTFAGWPLLAVYTVRS